MNNTILNIENLTKNYHTKKNSINVLNKLNFSINNGDFITIVGPSGCGKSTILSLIGNLEKISCGKINYVSKNPIIGYMFQEDALYPWLTVYDNCLIGLKIQKKLTKENIQNVNKLLKKYGLYEFKNSMPKQLSGGMKQRVALIRTLAINPDILLLDEPFSALDYQTRLSVSDNVYEIIKKEKKTAIMVTHDIAEAVTLGNKVIVLSKRPANIKSIYEINYQNDKKPSQRRNDNSFKEYYDLIWKDFDINEY